MAKEKQPIRNYGLIIQPLPAKEYIFGSEQRLRGQQILLPSADWTSFLPKGEVQHDNNSKGDSMSCVSFSGNNTIETIFNLYLAKNILDSNDRQWFVDNGYIENNEPNFSDRFTASMSKTSPYGNSIHNVAESIRKNGLVPQKVWDYPALYNDEIFKFSEWIKEPPASVKKLGLEFLKRFSVGYQAVYKKDWKKSLKYSPLHTGLHAYCNQYNGVYQYCSGSLNHAIMVAKPEWEIYDSYEIEGSFIKKVSSTYRFLDYAYYYNINSINNPIIFNDNSMQLKNDFLYQETEKSGAIGIAVNGKMMFGNTTNVLATFIMRNKGDIKGKTQTCASADWESAKPFGNLDGGLSGGDVYDGR